MSLPGFYLVKNAISRDESTGVGQIIATTPLSKLQYILGKVISNWVFLAAAAGVATLSAMGIQLMRGEAPEIALCGYLSPYLLITLPMMALVAAVAVLFESIRWLRGGLGNVVFFFLFLLSYWMMAALTFMALPMTMGAGEPLRPLIPEPTGALEIFRSMSAAGMELLPEYQGGLDLGNPFQAYGTVGTFVWNGVVWSVPSILGRLLWVAVAVGMAWLAAAFFDRFDPSSLATRVRRKETRSRRESDSQLAQPPYHPALTSIAASTSASRGIRMGVFLEIVRSELCLMLKGRRWWWYVVALGLILAALILPAAESRQIVMPLVCIWPLLIWSQIGSRETQNRTDQLVFSAPFPLRRHLIATWAAGIILALLAGSGVIVRLTLASSWSVLLSVVVAAAFIPAAALALGIWTGGSKLFEVVYIVLWTLGPMNQMMAALGFPLVADQYLAFDYMGLSDAAVSEGMPLYYAAITVLLLALSLIGRRRQLQA
jgi:ABC-type transport system involved in multi-copper enzyme maturation permease subunit